MAKSYFDGSTDKLILYNSVSCPAACELFKRDFLLSNLKKKIEIMEEIFLITVFKKFTGFSFNFHVVANNLTSKKSKVALEYVFEKAKLLRVRRHGELVRK